MRAGFAAMMLLSATLVYLGAASIELDRTECTDVACATGYTGTAAVTCASDGEFDLTNCVPLCVRPTTTTGYVITGCDTTNGAIAASSCNLGATCDTGYRTTGSGPTATCSSAFGTFTFTGCEAIPKCTLPTSTTGYITTGCAATSTNQLTEADCDVTCDTGNNYGPSGPGTDACASDGAEFTFSGCTPMCNLPSTTTGYITSGCTGTKTSGQCTVQCDTANEYTGTNPTDTCTTAGGDHALSGCTLNPKCSLPTSTTGYTTTGCDTSGGAKFASDCDVTCDTGNNYGPSGTATDACSSDGGTFALSGCSAMCTLPTDTTGYITTGCTGSQTSTQCTVGCDTGSDYIGTAADSCSTAGGMHTLSGCVRPKCTLPTSRTGYDTTNCDTAGGAIYKSACDVTCDTANNYAGTGVDDCTADGGTFALTGCLPQCNAPSPVPAGYVVTSCSGTIFASACAVACDTANDYEGTAVVTCSAGGADFTYSGCTAKPKCTLPTTSPGYDTSACNTGRGSTYGIFASQCSVTCADGYSGTPSATCSTAGEFTLSGCARTDTCTLPSSTTGYTTDRCDTVSGCSAPEIDTASCSVECDVGYTGTGADACPTNGGDFTLSGCAPMCVVPATTTGYDTSLCVTTNAAITEAQCTVSCASGYRSTGSGPADSCTEGFGTFTFSGCEAVPKCKLPSSTTGYDTGSCTATSSSQLTEAQCTVSCDVANNYGPSGTATDECASEGADFALSGCSPMCNLPSSTTGYLTSGCSGTRTSAQCTVTCDTANEYSGTNPTDTCTTAGGDHAFAGCTLNPKCTLPTDTTGFTTDNCPAANGGTAIFASQCTVECDTANNYGPSGTATDACNTDGGNFVLSGCSPMCVLPSTTTGYITTGCTGTKTSAQCTVTCDTANEYSGTNPTDTCTTAGGDHAFSGCTLNPKCSLPTTRTGYITGGCDDSSGAIFASACTVTCDTANNYAGTGVDTCTTDNGDFTLSGCMPQCTLPSPITTGYTVSGCSGTTLASACTVGCASGYTGTAVMTCPSAGGVHVLTGCEAVPKCTLPSTGTPGYTTTNCNPGRVDSYGITAAQCSVACAAGYTGAATATCSTDGSDFTLAGCTRMNTCTLPSSTTGYKTTWCDISGWTLPDSCTTTGSSGGTGSGNSNTTAAGEPDFAMPIRQCPLLMLACTYLALRFLQ